MCVGMHRQRGLKRSNDGRCRWPHPCTAVLVSSVPESWEKAASAAAARAGKSLRDLRVAEVSQLDLALEDGKVKHCRGKVKLSFKYENRG